MKKTLPDDYIECGWNVKNITIKGTNIANIQDEDLFKLAKTMLKRVYKNEEAITNAKTVRVNLFHLEADLDDGSHISIPFIVRKHKDKWYYVTPEYFMQDKDE